MPSPSVRDERGIALVLAIVALVVIGALVAGTMFVSTAEQRTSVNGLAASKAFEGADAGLQTAIANWSATANTAANGSTVATGSGNFSSSGASYSYTVSRLNDQLFLAQSVGSQGGATQTLSAVLRLVKVNPSVSAAVTAGGSVSVGGNASIIGTNTPPSGWGSCAPAPDMGGIRSSGSVSTNGNPTITGTPPTVPNDASVNPALFQGPFNQFKQMATIRLTGATGSGNYAVFNGMAPSTTGSPARCNRADLNNWGEPLRTGAYVSECTGYAPIVYISGNAKFNSTARGQGVLLVEGDLSIAGGFQWVGLVIATGEVKTGNGNAQITGALMAQNADIGDQTSFSGTPVVSYSRCALDYVINATAVARPIAMRPWGQMFQMF
jgi:Tfp pilus assembly protein PilX